MTDIKTWNAALEHAAKIADPFVIHTGKKPGQWRVRRAKIADEIRACKLKFDGAKE